MFVLLFCFEFSFAIHCFPALKMPNRPPSSNFNIENDVIIFAKIDFLLPTPCIDFSSKHLVSYFPITTGQISCTTIF